MGLLTDPRAGNVKMIKFLLQWERCLCFFMYISGIVWMAMLASPMFNDATYFSENALLPGLVTKESNLDYTARQYYDELSYEMKRYPNGMPYAWLLAKFNQLNLEVYSHNFSLNYPFAKHQFTGQNIYGIVRAPRAASTEAIVLSVPFRAFDSIHPTTLPSVALLLAFAKFCRRQKYWAKDIIFLVTEHEQLGMQAWLDAYHGVVSGHKDVLRAGDLAGRAGSIQAAINLEIHAVKVAYIDVKIEGLNGQLPNLDLVNLAQNAIKKEMIRGTFQKRFDINQKSSELKKWSHNLYTLSSMLVAQATGIPTGNHGLFHRYGIEAITLEGMERTTATERQQRAFDANFDRVGRIVESMFRSLNNLLERFHQSFFFYFLCSTDRYISIGLYMPSLVLIIGSLYIKAFAMWLKLQDYSHTIESSNDNDNYNNDQRVNIEQTYQVAYIASQLLWSHFFGILVMNSPKLFTSLGSHYWNLETENSISYGLILLTAISFSWSILNLSSSSKCHDGPLIYIITLVELATSLISIAMHNSSLALFAGIIYAPILLLLTPNSSISSKRKKFTCFLWTLLHPFAVASIIVMIYTYINFSEEPIGALGVRGFDAIKKSLVFSIIDSMIYGNCLFNLIVTVILPIWILLFNVIANQSISN